MAPLLERIERQPDERIRERELRQMGVEPARVRRYFESRYGLTFQAYCRARRLSRAFERIRDGEPIDDAVFETGYDSHSGFREAFQKVFGQTPGPRRRRAAGVPDVDRHADRPDDRRRHRRGAVPARVHRSPHDRGAAHHAAPRLGAALVPADHAHLQHAAATSWRSTSPARGSDFSVPLDAPGTPFEMRVWQALCEIPFGETRSYADIARTVGSPAAVRAVGRANGLNRIAIVIPCHRVVNKSGELGGYGGGLWRKRRLLHLEKSAGSKS